MKMFHTIVPLAMLAACGQSGTTDNSYTASTNTTAEPAAVDNMQQMDQGDASASAATDDTTYLAKAGAGDLFEIESSKAVMAKTEDAAVRDFARMMITAHTESTANVKAAATKAGLTVAPPQLDADQRAKVEAIGTASGDAAVRTYLDAQREAHAAALALHQSYAQDGQTAPLKAVAGEIVPVVQSHIDMLAKLPRS